MATETREATGQRVAPRRRFKLADGMILIAATACGCAVDGGLNALVRENGADALDLLGSLFGARRYPELAVLTILLVMPVAAAWTLALIPLSLLPPRPSLRRLAGRPGWMACCAFALALVLATAVFGGLFAVVGANQAMGLVELSPLLPIAFAPAILAVWLSLILGRRWRPEPTWLDRSGRVLGAFWVVMVIIGPIVLGTAFL